MKSYLISQLKAVKSLISEYGSTSTIHGIAYISSEKRTTFEKVLWLFAFTLSIGGCGCLIWDVYERWDKSPVIISFDEKTKPLSSFPYPAVTICAETKVRAEVLNFSREFRAYAADPLGYKPEPFKREAFFSTLHLCDQRLLLNKASNLRQLENLPVERDCLDTLRMISLPIHSIFKGFCVQNVPSNYSQYFWEIVTEDGICFNFNIVRDILRPGVLPHLQAGRLKSENFVEWSPQSGYSEGAGLRVEPMRALGTGICNGLTLDLWLKAESIDYLCTGPIQGFKVQLHTPSEYPQLSKRFLRAPLDQEVTALVKPKLIATSRKLRYYAPNRRNCFFEHERPLALFRAYSQENCELECLVNYTRALCGCVRFSMPRLNNTKVCNSSRILCILDAESRLAAQVNIGPEQETSNFQAKCRCLPGCTSLRYDVMVTQGPLTWRENERAVGKSNESLDGIYRTRVTIYFKDSQFITITRNEMYGLTDFVANCGGLLGLFMGVSLLSVVEILYFCTVRPFMLFHKPKQNEFIPKTPKKCTTTVVVKTFDDTLKRHRLAKMKRVVMRRRIDNRLRIDNLY